MKACQRSCPCGKHPETVLSPKGSVANLRVLMNTGEDGWAVTSMQWDGRDALGIRRNGPCNRNSTRSHEPLRPRRPHHRERLIIPRPGRTIAIPPPKDMIP